MHDRMSVKLVKKADIVGREQTPHCVEMIERYSQWQATSAKMALIGPSLDGQ